jgi:Glycosyltransferase family 87
VSSGTTPAQEATAAREAGPAQQAGPVPEPTPAPQAAAAAETAAPQAAADATAAAGRGADSAGRRWIRYRWAASRLITLLILLPENNILGDVRYYGRQLDVLFSPTGVRGALPEYPVPSFAVFLPPWWAALGNRVAYLVTFVILMIVIDAAFTAALWRAAGRRPGPGVWLWLLLVPCLGPLTFTRFDLVSAALAGGALLALAVRRPVATGLLAAAGAAVKLWPGALLPALLVPRAGRGRLATAALVTSGVAALVSLLAAGTDRLLSPLTWQGDRGLQIESLFAVPLLWGRVVSPGTWEAPYTRFFAFQIEGPGVRPLLALSTACMVGAVLVLGWLWWRVLRWDQRRPADVLPVVGLLSIGTAGLLVITNKTLSPQYLLWIGGLLAALGCVAPTEPLLPRLNRMLLGTCLVTQLLYPLGYGMLTTESWASWIGVALLTARNAALVLLTVLALRRVVVLTRPALR